jgi:hypothetical protein
MNQKTVKGMSEFNVKYDLIFKTLLCEKIGKEFRSTSKGEKGKLKGYTWPQQ